MATPKINIRNCDFGDVGRNVVYIRSDDFTLEVDGVTCTSVGGDAMNIGPAISAGAPESPGGSTSHEEQASEGKGKGLWHGWIVPTATNTTGAVLGNLISSFMRS